MSDLKPVSNKRLWASRVFIFIVLFLNLQASILFWIFPTRYSQSFALDGVIGQTVIRALAILFLMWNVPYVFAAIHPIRYKISLVEAIFMQAVGLIGETMIFLQLPESLIVLRQSIQRFILFDGLGFSLLTFAFVLVHTRLFLKRKEI